MCYANLSAFCRLHGSAGFFNLQEALGQFEAKCEEVKMKAGTSNIHQGVFLNFN